MSEKSKFYVEKFVSKNNRTFVVLKVDLGYTQMILSWDRSLCADLLNMTVSKLMSLVDGTYNIE